MKRSEGVRRGSRRRERGASLKKVRAEKKRREGMKRLRADNGREEAKRLRLIREHQDGCPLCEEEGEFCTLF